MGAYNLADINSSLSFFFNFLIFFIYALSQKVPILMTDNKTGWIRCNLELGKENLIASAVDREKTFGTEVPIKLTVPARKLIPLTYTKNISSLTSLQIP